LGSKHGFPYAKYPRKILYFFPAQIRFLSAFLVKPALKLV